MINHAAENEQANSQNFSSIYTAAAALKQGLIQFEWFYQQNYIIWWSKFEGNFNFRLMVTLQIKSHIYYGTASSPETDWVWVTTNIYHFIFPAFAFETAVWWAVHYEEQNQVTQIPNRKTWADWKQFEQDVVNLSLIKPSWTGLFISKVLYTVEEWSKHLL